MIQPTPKRTIAEQLLDAYPQESAIYFSSSIDELTFHLQFGPASKVINAAVTKTAATLTDELALEIIKATDATIHTYLDGYIRDTMSGEQCLLVFLEAAIKAQMEVTYKAQHRQALGVR